MTSLSRRSFVQTLCAAGVMTPLSAACQAPGAAVASGPFFAKKSAPIGIQLYTLGPDAMRDLVFKPLGMADTYFYRSDPGSRVATLYRGVNGKLQREPDRDFRFHSGAPA